MSKTKILLLSAFLCVGTLLGTSCNNDNDDFVIYTTNTEQSDTTNTQNQQGENNPETVSVSSVTLDKTTISLEVDETLQLTAIVSPDNATDKTVTWTSSDETVATVENGKVTAIKEGEATITAKVGDKTAECKVTVSAPAAKTITVSVDGDDATIKPSFTEDNVTDKLKMTISEGETELGTLTLQDTDGNFSGILDKEPSAEGVTLTASITTTGDATSSIESIADLIKNCAHKYTGTFKYKTDDKVMLTDDRAYIEFTLAEGQKKVSVNGQWYDVDQTSHKAYVAVEGNTEVTTRIKGKETLTAGKIYTIECTDVIDLGLSVLWCTSNATESETDQKTWEDAKTLANSIEGYTLPTADNFRELTGDKSVEGVTVSKTDKWDGTGTENGVTFSTDYGSVFFPAAGFDGGLDAGFEGGYWSGESYDDNSAYVLFFYEDAAVVYPFGVYDEYSVRLVRGL